MQRMISGLTTARGGLCRLGCCLGVLLTALPGALAQLDLRAAQSRPELPDWSRPQTTVALVTGIIVLPFYFVVLRLLWLRRKHYPIAGRGATYLLATQLIVIEHALIYTVVGIAYPYGAPCGAQFFMHYLTTMLAGVLYTMRGWTLAFRLEIMTFLEESKWREEKQRMLQEHYERNERENGDQSMQDTDRPMEDAVVPLEQNKSNQQTQNGQLSTSIAVKSDEPVATNPIPGEWFIHHRRWIEKGFLYPIMLGFTLFVVVSMIVIITLDPDTAPLNAQLRKQGILKDTDPDIPGMFTTHTLLTSPVCLASSVQIIAFLSILFLILCPIICWCMWRIWLDQKRRDARRKDQEDAYRLIHGSEMPKPASLGGIEMNDAPEVKKELGLIVFLATIDSMAYTPIQIWAVEWQYFNLMLAFAVMCLLSVAWPLWTSYSISRHHRALLGSGSKVKSAGDRLPHHRPYFTLKYILRTPSTYSVLVAFLQKEYSSENALFYTEAREFEKATKALEQRISTWTSSIDEDDEDSRGPASGGGRSKLATRTKKASVLTSTRQARRLTAGGGSLLRSPSLDPPNASAGSGGGGGTESILSSTGTPIAAPQTPIKKSKYASGGSITVSPPQSPLSPGLMSSPSAVTLESPTGDSMNWGAAGSPLLDGRASGSFVQMSAATSLQPQQATELVGMEQAVAEVDYHALHVESAHLKAWALKISEMYLQRSAQFEINIAEDLSRLVLGQVQQLEKWAPSPSGLDASDYPVPPPFPLSTLYRGTCLAIFQLIERDSFRRFLMTPGFQALLAKADEDELARVEKQVDLRQDTDMQLDKAMKQLASPKPPQSTMASTLGYGASKRGNSALPMQSINRGVSRRQISAVRQDDPAMNEDDEDELEELQLPPTVLVPGTVAAAEDLDENPTEQV